MHLFHSWKEDTEEYNCFVPERVIHIGGFAIKEEEHTMKITFRIRTCKCGKRQTKLMSGEWKDFKFNKGDTIPFGKGVQIQIK